MKNCRNVVLSGMILLFALLCINSNALSSNNVPNTMDSKESVLSKKTSSIAIHLPDPRFEEAVRAAIGKPTGDILAEDVAEIVELDVSGMDIVDLTGIEHFIALEILDCSINRLTKLDVSRNTALRILDCQGDPDTKGNQLGTLDVSHNVALTELRCRINGLTELDVSENSILESLDCGVNELKTLDISSNTNLRYLVCSRNMLRELDVSKNLLLEEIWCGVNALTTLDVSHNAALKRLYCGENKLVSLDVTKNPALEMLYCAENFFPDRSAITGLQENKLKRFTFSPQRQ